MMNFWSTKFFILSFLIYLFRHTQSGALDNVVKIKRAGNDVDARVTSRSRKSSDSVVGSATSVTILTDQDTRENSHTLD